MNQSLPYRSQCNCFCHTRENVMHMDACCRPDPTEEDYENNKSYREQLEAMRAEKTPETRKAEYPLTPEEAVMVQCERCKGTGDDSDIVSPGSIHECDVCKGYGKYGLTPGKAVMKEIIDTKLNEMLVENMAEHIDKTWMGTPEPTPLDEKVQQDIAELDAGRLPEEQFTTEEEYALAKQLDGRMSEEVERFYNSGGHRRPDKLPPKAIKQIKFNQAKKKRKQQKQSRKKNR